MIMILSNNFKKIIMNASLGSNTYRPISLLLLAIFALIFISGCAGKKSSSNGEFTSWSAVSPNVLAQFSNGNSTVISTTGTISQTNSNVNASILLDSGYNISSVTLNQTATNFVTFSAAAGDTIVKDSAGANTLFTNQKATTIGILANPYYYGYEYQTYGAWGAFGTAVSPGNAVSVGAITAASAIPSSGSAVFTGASNGYLIDGGFAYLTNASMTANANFSTRTISFSTSSSTLTGKIGGTVSAAEWLNLTGSMTYSAGANKLTGSVTSASGMSGSIIGNFYGPSANEIGGTYGLTKTTTGGSLVGGFGGKR
jgi:hypothetical protein